MSHAKRSSLTMSCTQLAFKADLANLDLEEDDGVLAEGTKDEDDAGDDPCLNSRQALRLGAVGLDGVEDVDEDEEDRHQEGHAARYDFRIDQERYPRHNDEEAWIRMTKIP